MTDLLQLPDLPPAWKVHAGLLGIETGQSEDGTWSASIDYFETVETEKGEPEREAVNALVYRLNLTQRTIDE